MHSETKKDSITGSTDESTLIDRTNPLQFISDSQCFKFYRFSKTSIIFITNLVDPFVTVNNRNGRSLPVIFQVLICLKFLATGTFLSTVGLVHGVAKSVAWICVHRVCRALTVRAIYEIGFDKEDLQAVRQGFHALTSKY